MKQGGYELVIYPKQMNIRKKRFSLLIAFLTITTIIYAQQVGLNSPYSRYGYGLLTNQAPGASEAMGGIGYGLRRSQQVNWLNPASYSKLDTLTFIFDMGVSGHLAKMDDSANARDYYNGNFDYAAIQFPLFRNVGASVGLLPFSKMGYNFGDERYTSGTRYYETYRGTGGLNQIYVGLAWELFKNFSLGANLSYLFGDFTRSNVVTPASSSALIGETKYNYVFREMKYDFGIQYTIPFDKERSLTLGAVYSPQLALSADVNPSEMLYGVDPYQNPWYGPVQILKTDTLNNASFQLPHSFGAGFTYESRHFLFGVDGTYQLWKNRDYPDILDDLSNQQRYNDLLRVNAGVEYVVDPLSQNYFHRVRLRGGFSFSNSYTNFYVNDPSNLNNGAVGTGSYKEYGVNVGVGLPMRDLMSGHVSMLNVGFGYSRQQPDSDYLIRQDMFKISINMNINEFWFFKRQFN